MIVDEILKFTWAPSGIVCPDPDTAWATHKFLREAILDRHVYLNKVVSFQIYSATRFESAGVKLIARHPQIGESYPEIVRNLQDKIFLTLESAVQFSLHQGMNFVENGKHEVVTKKGYPVTTLCITPDVCRCLVGNAIIKLKLLYDCGYRNMADNSNGLTSTYFPCITEYTLEKYVRVLPRREYNNIVPMRYYNGLTVEVLRNILTTWGNYIRNKDVKKEEYEWLSSFDHLI